MKPKNPQAKTGAPRTPEERRLADARRAWRKLEAGRGKRRVLWQVRGKP